MLAERTHQGFEALRPMGAIATRSFSHIDSRPIVPAIGAEAPADKPVASPADLRDHALRLAGYVLEFSPQVPKEQGHAAAAEITAWA